MPSTLIGGSPARPESMIDPSCGVYTPVSELKSDVLPAPLGPMTARISPRCIWSDTAIRLVTPPKRSVTLSTSKTMSSACAAVTDCPTVVTSQALGRWDRERFGARRDVKTVQLGGPTLCRDQPSRPEDHHQQYDGADPHEFVGGRHLVFQELGQPGQHGRPCQRTGKRSHATKHHIGDDENGVVEHEVVRCEHADLARKESASDTGRRCADRKGRELHLRGVDAGGLRRNFVLSHGRPSSPQPRLFESSERPNDKD